MSDYNKYVLAVNKIFEVIGKIKNNYTDKDNTGYIANIEEYKQVVVNSANTFSNKKEDTITEQPSMQKLDSLEANYNKSSAF